MGGYTFGLVQDCSNSIANSLGLLQSCTKASIVDFNVQLSWDGRGLYHVSMEKLINIPKSQSANKFRSCLEKFNGICHKDVGFIKYFTYINR